MAQLAAELLGLELDLVRFDLGDSDMPESPQAGGSGPDRRARVRGRRRLQATARSGSTRRWRRGPDAWGARRSPCRRPPRVRDAELLARTGWRADADGESPPEGARHGPAGAFGAKFVEVHSTGTRPAAGAARGLGDRRRPDPQREDARARSSVGPSADRHGVVRGDVHRRRHRPDRERHPRRLPGRGERRRARRSRSSSSASPDRCTPTGPRA